MQNIEETVFKAHEIFGNNLRLGVNFLISQGLTAANALDAMSTLAFTHWFDLEFQLLKNALPEKSDMRLAMHKNAQDLVEQRLNQINVPKKEKKK